MVAYLVVPDTIDIPVLMIVLQQKSSKNGRKPDM